MRAARPSRTSPSVRAPRAGRVSIFRSFLSPCLFASLVTFSTPAVLARRTPTSWKFKPAWRNNNSRFYARPGPRLVVSCVACARYQRPVIPGVPDPLPRTESGGRCCAEKVSPNRRVIFRRSQYVEYGEIALSCVGNSNFWNIWLSTVAASEWIDNY